MDPWGGGGAPYFFCICIHASRVYFVAVKSLASCSRTNDQASRTPPRAPPRAAGSAVVAPWRAPRPEETENAKIQALGAIVPAATSFAGRFSVGLRRLRFKMQCFREAWVRHLGAHPRTFIDRNANRTPASVDDRVNLGNKKPLEAKVPGFPHVVYPEC